jgi:catechol 2,3-dioxygenase-like lactoylglutathione lyase family enzyme
MTGLHSDPELPNIPQWRGVSHLAMVTPDMDATVRFYTGVLGMPLVATLMAGPMRHYFFEIAPGNTLAFFEIPGMETFSKGAGAPPDRAIQFDHLSFNVADEHALEMLQWRIKAAGSEVTRVVDHDIMKSIYFTDPNGIALEASYWVADPTSRPADTTDSLFFSDPNPVPAVAEIAAGALSDLPATHLV